MRKKLFNIGFWVSLGLLIAFYSYFWYSYGYNKGDIDFLGAIIIIIYVGIITLMAYYDRYYYERKSALKIALFYGFPLLLLYLFWLLVGFEITKISVYFIYTFLFLILNYLVASLINEPKKR